MLNILFSTEIREIKKELSRARTDLDSARLREKVVIARQELEKEQKTCRKTSKELEAMSSLHKKPVKERNDADNTKARLQELEAIIACLEQEVRNEKRDKEIFEEETTRLRDVCDHLDEKNKQTLSDLQALQEENQELAKQLFDVNNNKDTRKDLARVTEERKELKHSKEHCENVEKQLGEAKANMEKQLAASHFQDKATSPVEPKECDIKGLCEPRTWSFFLKTVSFASITLCLHYHLFPIKLRTHDTGRIFEPDILSS